MAVSLEQAVAQIVQLGDAMSDLKKNIQDLQAENLDLRSQLEVQADRRQGKQGQAAAMRSRNCVR